MILQEGGAGGGRGLKLVAVGFIFHFYNNNDSQMTAASERQPVELGVLFSRHDDGKIGVS
jgi:hypothetical protein